MITERLREQADLSPIERSIANHFLERSEWGWGIDPQGLRFLLNEPCDRHQLAVMVVENGLGAADEVVVEDGVERIHDPCRVDHLGQHPQQLKLAIEGDGADVMGYTCWAPSTSSPPPRARCASDTGSSAWTSTVRDRGTPGASGRTRSMVPPCVRH